MVDLIKCMGFHYPSPLGEGKGERVILKIIDYNKINEWGWDSPGEHPGPEIKPPHQPEIKPPNGPTIEPPQPDIKPSPPIPEIPPNPVPEVNQL